MVIIKILKIEDVYKKKILLFKRRKKGVNNNIKNNFLIQNIAQNETFVQNRVGLIYKIAKYLCYYIYLASSRFINYITLILLCLYYYVITYISIFL